MLVEAATIVKEAVFPAACGFSLESFNRRTDAENPGYYVGARHPSKAKSGVSGKFASGAQLPKDSPVSPKSGKSHPEGYALLKHVVNLKHAGQTSQVGWPTKPHLLSWTPDLTDEEERKDLKSLFDKRLWNCYHGKAFPLSLQ
ncbi:hypothetical protein PENPOL_c015G09414 [Penicillium polonicum]|uniref:Uncharacterized protein n=1 Tax=Penicillium polonicum TaxID=60169 RepID=A0A1V6NB57_PENPO|nr:hypothetical protein PENPOL_c015G09414 [Penicillium polonicum]